MLNSQAGEDVLKDDFIGFERLKVDDNHPRGWDILLPYSSINRALFSV